MTSDYTLQKKINKHILTQKKTTFLSRQKNVLKSKV